MSALNADQERILAPVLEKSTDEDRAEILEAVVAANAVSGSYLIADSLMGMRQRERWQWGFMLGKFDQYISQPNYCNNRKERYWFKR